MVSSQKENEMKRVGVIGFGDMGSGLALILIKNNATGETIVISVRFT